MSVPTIDSSLTYRFITAARARQSRYQLDWTLLMCTLILIAFGWVMVGSASIAVAEKLTGNEFHFLRHQAIHVLVGLLLGWICMRIPVSRWEKINPYLLLMSMGLLLLVLAVGQTVNGSTRWFSLGFVSVQPSELMKLSMIMYLAGYIVRREDQIKNSLKGFMYPIILMSVVAILLLLEPDFGAMAVISVLTFLMLYIGGVRLRQFAMLSLVMFIAFALVALSEPYRIERLKSFWDPWADPLNSGYQLSQSLIAFGRGEWFGVGLGNGIQKLFYLPEAHTDFLLAVISEETGLFGIICVIGLFCAVVYRSARIGYLSYISHHYYAAYLAFGMGMLIGVQAFTNIGVNMGVLPTKGLALPLMSYGGSNMVASCVAIGILLRIYHEARPNQAELSKQRRSR